MSVYIDELFFFNFIVDYLLVYTAALISSSPVRRLRFLLSAFIGALYSILFLFPALAFTGSLPAKAAAACVMTYTAFGIEKFSLYLRRCAVLFISCFMFAGFFEFLLGLSALQDYAVPPTLVLTACAVLAYILLTHFLRGTPATDAHPVPFSQAHIETDSGSVDLSVLADTGNRLRDPFTGDSVLILTLDAGKALLPDDIYLALKENGAVKALPVGGCGYRLIPYKSIGGDGFLLAVRPKALKLNGKTCRHTLIAFTQADISSGAGYAGISGV